MSRMSFVNRFYKEKYICIECEKSFKSEQVEDTWRCPICNNYIHIYAETEDGECRITLIRKKAKEVVEGDMYVFHGHQSEGGSHVFKVTIKNGTAHISIKGYGTKTDDAESPVNLQTGSWSSLPKW